MEIGYGRTPEIDRRSVVRVPLTDEERGRRNPGRVRAGFVPTPPVEEPGRPFYRRDNRNSYRVRVPGEKTRFGPERATPIR